MLKVLSKLLKLVNAVIFVMLHKESANLMKPVLEVGLLLGFLFGQGASLGHADQSLQEIVVVQVVHVE